MVWQNVLPLEKGMANHFNILALRTLWIVKVKIAQSCQTLPPLGLYSPMNSLGQNVVWSLNLISDSSAFSKSSLNIWKFSVHVLSKTCLENFEHYFASMWDEYNSVVVWTFFGIAFLWDWNENWPFLVLWPLLSFPNLPAYWVQHFHSVIF